MFFITVPTIISGNPNAPVIVYKDFCCHIEFLLNVCYHWPGYNDW